jgi:hypothetical protein
MHILRPYRLLLFALGVGVSSCGTAAAAAFVSERVGDGRFNTTRIGNYWVWTTPDQEIL